MHSFTFSIQALAVETWETSQHFFAQTVNFDKQPLLTLQLLYNVTSSFSAITDTPSLAEFNLLKNTKKFIFET